MIDALLLATKDLILQAPFGWDAQTLDVMPDGRPPGKVAQWFCAIHQGKETSVMRNALDERFGVILTLTMVIGPGLREKIGASNRPGLTLTSREVRTLAKESGFNSRLRQLKTFLHGNWFVIGLANEYLQAWYGAAGVVDGFAEPCYAFEGPDELKVVGGEWLGANPNHADAALVADLHLDGARRLQAIASYT